ncbi:MAG: hypothetical protein U1E58_15860 [Tabrizicola sp.]
MALSLPLFLCGDSPFFAIPESADTSIIVVLALVATGLRVWSIGLLYSREFDLYTISLTCWLVVTGIRASASHASPSAVEQSLVLGLGLILDSVQIWALLLAISRAKRRQNQPVNQSAV